MKYRMALNYHHGTFLPTSSASSCCRRTCAGFISAVSTSLRGRGRENFLHRNDKLEHTSPCKNLGARKIFAIAEPPVQTAHGETPNDFVLESDPAAGQDANRGRSFDWNRQWYPVAVANDLHTDAPYGVTVIGRPLAVWWDAANSKWQVYADQCPHRLAPLSEGSISKDGQLRCSYHGWTFKGDGGECTRIPQALPTSARPIHEVKRACVQVYPSLEQQGILWFWPDLSQGSINVEAAASPPPVFPWLSDPNFAFDMSSRDLEFGYEMLLENVVDPAHGPFAHHSIQGNRDTASPLTLNVTKIDPSGFVGDGDVGSVDFTAPCTVTYEARLPPQSTMQDVMTGEDSSNYFMNAIYNLLNKVQPQKERMVAIIALSIPVSPGRSRIIWAFPRNFATSILKFVPKWVFHRTLNKLFDSDIVYLNLLERRLEFHGSDKWSKLCYAPASADRYVHAFRKWLRDYAGGAPDWAGRFENRLPPSPPKRIMMDRYYTHVLKCKGCKRALKNFKALEILLQVLPVALLGLVVATLAAVSSLQRLRPFSVPLVCVAAASALVSRWLSHFIHTTFYFEDYNHAAVK